MNEGERLFRFALYGRANAGKTCILATLAMPHVATEGLSCVWRGTAADAPRPDGPEASWDGTDPAAARFRGAQWLCAAATALEKGELPPPNTNSREPFRFRYDLKERGFDYRVELIDYSGELLDPEVSTGQLAQRLRDHLREFDGILVLAAAPRRGQGGGDLAADLHKLQMAFALLRDEGKQTLPLGALVGLVINKWDRRMIGEAKESLIAFFASADSRSHQALRDALQTNCPDDFKVFAASAFGPPRQEGGRELPPRILPMPSFGLEEPLLWAARRRLSMAADRDLAALEAETAKFRWWHLEQPFTRRYARLAARVHALHGAYPPDFSHHQKADQLLARARVACGPQVAALVGILLLLWGLGTATADYIKYFHHRATLLDGEDLDVGRLEAAEEWLMTSADPSLWQSPLGALVLSRGRAQQYLQEVQQRLIVARELARRNNENRIALRAWKDRFASAHDLEAITNLAAASRHLPWPEKPDDDIRSEYAELRQQIEARNQSLQRAAEVSRNEQMYWDAMAIRHLPEAARIVVVCPLTPAVKEKLRKHFRRSAGAILRADVEECLRYQQWKEGQEKLDACLNDNRVKGLLSDEQLVMIDDLRLKLQRTQDRWLYDQCRRDKTQDACRRYLKESPLPNPRMKPFVHKYLKYLDSIQGVLTLKVSLSRIDWGADGWDSEEKNRVRVWVNGAEEPNLDEVEVLSKANTSTSDVGQFTLKGKRDGSVKLRVWIWRDSDKLFSRNRKQGEGEATVTLEHLISKGCEVGLDRFNNKAFLKVVGGIPTEPPLPVYQE